MLKKVVARIIDEISDILLILKFLPLPKYYLLMFTLTGTLQLIAPQPNELPLTSP